MAEHPVQNSGMHLSALAAELGGRVQGGDALFRTVSIDSRTLQQGDLFIALTGPHFDGHEFVAEAQAKGAVAVMVSRAVATTLPQLQVDDTRLALGRLAAYWRQCHRIPLVAITGSNGKTTVKEMLASILRQHHRVLVTQGNLNNEIGVPLMLLRLTSEHDLAVIEMGASRQGDIDYLTRLAQPDVALITNVAPAHLEGFGDIAGIARAKGEIFTGLSADGTAILNADDTRIGVWRVMAGQHKSLCFGLRHEADVTAAGLCEHNHLGCSFKLCTPIGTTDVTLHLAGRHNVMNALAATSAALALSIPLEDIRRGLETMAAVSGRLAVHRGIHDSCLIDDTYNANPGSVRAALEVLASSEGEKILVLGDMAELGNSARALHEQVGRQARIHGVDYVLTIGQHAELAAGTFGAGGRHFTGFAELIEGVRHILQQSCHPYQHRTVLIKGSRSMGMERVVEALSADQPSSALSGGNGHESSHSKQSRLGID